MVADVRDQPALDGAVAHRDERFGGLDAALAVAGAIVGGEPAWATDDDAWSTMLGINLEGVWRLARAAVPALLRASDASPGALHRGVVGRRARSVFRSSPRTRRPSTASMGSSAAWPPSWDRRASPSTPSHPARPPPPSLDASAVVYGLDDTAEFATHHQLGRLIDPDEVAATLQWLCGPDSSAITGAVLHVDAGMTAGCTGASAHLAGGARPGHPARRRWHGPHRRRARCG